MARVLLKAVVVTTAGAALWGLVALGVEPLEEPDVPTLVSDIAISVLVVGWIFIITPSAATRKAYNLLLVGFGLLFLASLADVLGELYEVPQRHGLVETAGFVAGMLLVTFGLYFWTRDQREAYRLLNQQKDALEQISVTDDLTGLYNARHFKSQLAHELERAHRYGRELSLLFIDIDNFKNFNDSYGHLEGNKVLQSCANIVSSALRDSDSPFRFGGEELTVILPETGEDEAHAVAERIRQSFEQKRFFPENRGPVSTTVSIGVAPSSPGDTPDQLVDKADGAMYQAKMRGKNQVVRWQRT